MVLSMCHPSLRSWCTLSQQSCYVSTLWYKGWDSEIKFYLLLILKIIIVCLIETLDTGIESPVPTSGERTSGPSDASIDGGRNRLRPAREEGISVVSHEKSGAQSFPLGFGWD